MTTPIAPNAWSAPQNGPTGDLDAVNTSAGFNQLLISHTPLLLYDGAQIVTPSGGTGFKWETLGSGTDIDQPFTLPGSTLGRVVLPINVVGNGADVAISLYSDSAGKPNLNAGPLTMVNLPASILTQIAAPYGIGTTPPADAPSATPPALAPANYNTFFCQGGTTVYNWNPPAGSLNGFYQSAATMTSGNFFAVAGGWDSTAAAPVAAAVTVQYEGGQVVGPPINQPALPKAAANLGMTACGAYAVVTGGTTTLSNAINNVWVAGWNNLTGVLGQWSAQANLPVAVSSHATASWNSNTVYVIGGTNTSGLPVTNIQRATLNNGQISSWTQENAFPFAISGALAAVVDNWLIVTGNFGTTDVSIHYAPIKSDGSLGSWQTNPNTLLTQVGSAGGSNQPGSGIVTTDSALIIVGGASGASPVPVDVIQPITAGTYGLSNTSYQYHLNSPDGATGSQLAGAFAVGDGSWDLVGLEPSTSKYWVTNLLPVPMISVPLYTVGLASATYHILIQQQQGETASDYVQIGVLDNSALPANAQTAPRHSSTWTTLTGYSIPMSVYDSSVSANGLVRHTWEDNYGYGQASRYDTYFYNQNRLLYGAASATIKPNNPLNSNPTFTTGTSPWIAVNGTLTQSNAQTQGGYPFSGLLTPTGGFSSASIRSELMTVHQSLYGNDAWYYVAGHFYTPTTWSSFSLSVSWYDTGRNFISTFNHTISLTGATWTLAQNWYQPPASALYAQITPIIGGTPSSANTLYCSNVFMIKSLETVKSFATAAQINYSGYPNTWPPTGVTLLI